MNLKGCQVNGWLVIGSWSSGLLKSYRNTTASTNSYLEAGGRVEGKIAAGSLKLFISD